MKGRKKMKLVFPENMQSSEPTIPIQWCLGRSETESLKAKNARNIKVLIVVSYEDGRHEDRYLVPIEDVMTYISFNRPGKHTVFAKVVFWDCNNESSMNFLLDTVYTQRFSFRVLNTTNTDFVEDSHFYSMGVAVLSSSDDGEVIVPKEHFPPEPPEWLQRIANFGFADPPYDECAFRGRKFWLLIKLPVLAFWFLFTTFVRLIGAGFLSLCGVRGIKYSPIFHPWNEDMNDVWYFTSSRNTWFKHDGYGNARSRFIYLIHPLLYIGLFAFVTYLKHTLGLSYGEVILKIWGVLLIFFFAIFDFLFRFFSKFGVTVITIATVIFILRMIRRNLKKRAREKIAKDAYDMKTKVALDKQSYDDLYRLLACGRAPKTPSLDALPKQKQTLHLKYQKLKAKVCRPYASR